MAAIQSPQTLARRQSSAGRSLPSFQLACQSNLPGAPSQGRCWAVTGSMAFSLFEGGGGGAAPRPKGVIPQRAAAADPGHRRSPAPPLQSAHHLYQSAFCLFYLPPHPHPFIQLSLLLHPSVRLPVSPPSTHSARLLRRSPTSGPLRTGPQRKTPTTTSF